MSLLQIIRSDGFRRWDGLKISESQIPVAKHRRTTIIAAPCKMALMIIEISDMLRLGGTGRIAGCSVHRGLVAYFGDNKRN